MSKKELTTINNMSKELEDQLLRSFLANSHSKLLTWDSIIVKVKDTDLIFTPEYGENNNMIGFRCNAEAVAGNLKGRIDIKAQFVIPEDMKVTFECDNENLQNLMESMEMIKTDGSYPMNETIDTLRKREIEEPIKGIYGNSWKKGDD
jgi:hypothetical protein